ncbi:MAG: AlpA family phage regulatory protein [Alphaproteobacteria bacterium]|nr:AlpA family phage regulatory protein [Alphaproteobacteria bacterium]MYF07184.1 AlpA family phage regulatory protein [Rhodospirillaceae bacterium]
MLPKLLTIAQVGEALGLGRGVIYRLLKDDDSFPRPLYIRPNVPRFNEDEIREWLEARAQAAP